MDGLNLNGYTPEQIREGIVFLEAHKLGKLSPHNEPSEKTLQKFNDMNNKIDNLKDGVAEINVKLEKTIILIQEEFKKNYEDHCRIEKQTTKTNGTVKWHSKLFYLTIGGGSVILFIMTAVLIPYINSRFINRPLTERDIIRIIDNNYSQVK